MQNQQSVFRELEKSIYTSLENYSNVHRGSGHFSVVSTRLYEEARKIILDYLELDSTYTVIFCSALGASMLAKKLDLGTFRVISSETAGLATGVYAAAVKSNKIPKGLILQSGGGTTRLVSPDKIIWAGAPDRLEAGTPAIINVIAFARALQLMKTRDEKCLFINEGSAVNGSLSGITEVNTGTELLDELNKSIVGKNTLVPVVNGTAEYLNLDYAASTPALKPVMDTYLKFLTARQESGKNIVELTRKIISEALNVPSEKYDIIFTSNTTESVNIAASGYKDLVNGRSDVILTTLEHNSNDLPWRICSDGSVKRIKADSNGLIDTNELERTLVENKRVKLVAISAASNVLGTCNNLEQISAITHKYGAKLFVDAAQLIAHRKTDVGCWGTDFLVFSGHKVYAPFGTGVLIARKGLLNFSTERMNEIISSGEENIAGIAALGKALQLMKCTGMDMIMEEEQKLLRFALAGMSKIEGLKIYGITDPEKFINRSSVISFSLKNVWPDKLAEALAGEGIGIRYGCHCAHILVKNILNVGPFLEKFQLIIANLFRTLRFPGVARVSFGLGITEKDISRFLWVLEKISSVKNKKPAPSYKMKMEYFTKSVTEKVYGL